MSEESAAFKVPIGTTLIALTLLLASVVPPCGASQVPPPDRHFQAGSLSVIPPEAGRSDGGHAEKARVVGGGWRSHGNDLLYTQHVSGATAARARATRDFMTRFAIISRVVAVYDAVRDGVDDKLTNDILGFRVRMSVDWSLRHPGLGCMISRKF